LATTGKIVNENYNFLAKVGFRPTCQGTDGNKELEKQEVRKSNIWRKVRKGI